MMMSSSSAGSCAASSSSPLPLELADPTLYRERGYVDGAWLDADDASTLDVTNPATNSFLGKVADMGAAETRRAIEAADAAWPAWRAKTGKERGALLRRWFELIN